MPDTDPATPPAPPATGPHIDYDAVVIGAGFGGLYALHRLREHGFSCHGYETGDDVGGTWYWNRYPGARCDVESLDYCYSFSSELHSSWRWSERYATQPEILDYAGHVADRFGLRRFITFRTRITSAVYEEPSGTWLLTADDGTQVRARFCVTAVGCLSASQVPRIPGLGTFEGTTHHTSRWPHEGVDLTGRRVAVIGTGSSGIQCIPRIAAQAERLTVFQRTANYSLPARNRPLSGREQWRAESELAALREEALTSRAGHHLCSTGRAVLEELPQAREAEFERQWSIGGQEILNTYTDVLRDRQANALLADFVRDKIRGIVDDPATADTLTPVDHPLGSKRIPLDTDYFATYNLPHVDLVDLRKEPLEEITPEGIRTARDTYAVDMIVFATGFDAMTGPLTRIDIRGRDGVRLKETWRDGPHTYLGLAVSGFPNLLTITGPGSPSVLANMIRGIEQHVDWIVDALARLRTRGLTRIEADPTAQEDWGRHVNEVAELTLYPDADSWYLGSNIEGKPRVFMPYVGGLDRYRRICDDVAVNGYSGFTLSGDGDGDGH